MAFSPKFSITNQITNSITRIERARGFLESARFSKDWIGKMENRAFVIEAHHTTHIEGTHLSMEQSERLIRGESVPEANIEDSRELLNFRNAYEYVTGCLDNGEPISERLIKEIHRNLVYGVRGNNADPGQYRRLQNYVINASTGEVIYTPPAAANIPILMSELVVWLNSDLAVHPLLISGITQFQLVHIHPFLDGNGRTSRLLSTLCLYRSGYDFKRLFSISEYYDRDRNSFYKAIQSVRDNYMDMTSWLEYYTMGLETQVTELKQVSERIMQCDQVVRTYHLNERQGKAIEYLLGSGKMTIQDYERICPGVNRRTLQRDIKFMQNLHLLASEGATNRLTYLLRIQTCDNLRHNLRHRAFPSKITMLKD